jgi:hypothetical protein
LTMLLLQLRNMIAVNFDLFLPTNSHFFPRRQNRKARK